MWTVVLAFLAGAGAYHLAVANRLTAQESQQLRGLLASSPESMRAIAQGVANHDARLTDLANRLGMLESKVDSYRAAMVQTARAVVPAPRAMPVRQVVQPQEQEPEPYDPSRRWKLLELE